MDTQAAQNLNQEAFHFGHLKVVLMAALVLVGISWMKDPGLFNVFKNQKAQVAVTSSNAPRYYAYVPAAEDARPMVAGASTVSQGPMIINEDGSLSPALDTGSVLGVSTEDLNLSLQNISVKEIPDSTDAVQKYQADADAIENNYMNDLEFETAITSDNQQQIDKQYEKVSRISSELQKLPVPKSLVELHKNKILQYNAAATILQNYTKADENPELVSQALGIFMQAQTQIENLTPGENVLAGQ